MIEIVGLFHRLKGRFYNLLMGVSKNNGTPKSSILIGFSIINHPFRGYPYFWKFPYTELGYNPFTKYQHRKDRQMKEETWKNGVEDGADALQTQRTREGV